MGYQRIARLLAYAAAALFWVTQTIVLLGGLVLAYYGLKNLFTGSEVFGFVMFCVGFFFILWYSELRGEAGKQAEARQKDDARVTKFVGEYSRQRAECDREEVWECVRCGETVNEPYDVCWQCSAPRPNPFRRLLGSVWASAHNVALQLSGLPLKLLLIVIVALVMLFIRGLPQTAWIVFFAAALLVVFDHLVFRA